MESIYMLENQIIRSKLMKFQAENDRLRRENAQLRKERDAAKGFIKGTCYTCALQESRTSKCSLYKTLTAKGSTVPLDPECPFWQLRIPQEGEADGVLP